MKKTTQSLEQLLAVKEKEAETLRKKIEEEKAKNNPKSIMDRVKTLSDVLKLAKPDKDDLVILNYKGKSKRRLFSKHMLILELIAEVLNEGHEVKANGKEYRYYPYFYVSSGFVFIRTTHCVAATATTASASRLCFKTRALAEYAGKIFLAEHKAAFTV